MVLSLALPTFEKLQIGRICRVMGHLGSEPLLTGWLGSSSELRVSASFHYFNLECYYTGPVVDLDRYQFSNCRPIIVNQWSTAITNLLLNWECPWNLIARPHRLKYENSLARIPDPIRPTRWGPDQPTHEAGIFRKLAPTRTPDPNRLTTRENGHSLHTLVMLALARLWQLSCVVMGSCGQVLWTPLNWCVLDELSL